MMKTIITLMLSIGLLSLSGCDSHTRFRDFLNDRIATELQHVDIADYDSIVIMPRVGCGSCIYKSEQFFKKHLNSTKVLFIFTKIDNQKKLNIEIGRESLNRENVFLDKKNAFIKSYFEDSAYPLLLERMPNDKFDYRLLPGIKPD